MGSVKHQLGIVAETQWATAATVSRFLEFTSETLERRNTIATSAGIRSGRRYGGQGRRITRHDAAGTVNTEVATTGFGLLFEHLLGAVTTTVNVTSTAFTHTFTPGSLLGKSLTLQKGVQKADGTVQAFTYPGAKIVSADFSVAQDGLLMAAWEFDAQQELSATALVTASYTTPRVFTYSEGALLLEDATVASVRSVGSFRIRNNLLTERFFLGNQGTKSEPINVPFDEISGSLDVEFQTTSGFYAGFVADTAFDLKLKFVGDVITTGGGGYSSTLQFHAEDVRFEGETPKVGGPELVYMDVPFVGLDSSGGGDSALAITYITSDANP